MIYVSDELERVFDDRRRVVDILRCRHLREWAEAKRDRLLAAARQNPFWNEDAIFHEFRDVDLCFPNEPKFFSRLLTTPDSFEWLSNFDRLEFVRTEAVTPSIEYLEHGSWRISLPDRPMSVGLLRMMAHEIGHHLYEREHPISSEESLILSEASALRHEVEVLQAILIESEFSEYLSYQRQWWQVNCYAEYVEHQEIRRGTSRMRPRKLWCLEWASSRVGYSNILARATDSVFGFTGDTK